MNPLKIELTDKQKEQLEPYFQAVRADNKAGRTPAIAAQIWPDGMIVRFLNREEGQALSKALGGDFNGTYESAEESLRSRPAEKKR